MQTIRELLSRDLSRPIEEVVKLEQQDEATVHGEISEYVATARIKKQYIQVLDAMASAPSDLTEAVGVWVSGFFGSGKSSFAKNLGYALANRPVLGKPAGALFLEQLEHQAPQDPQVQKIADLLQYVQARYQAQVLLFDVQVDRAVRRSDEPIAEIMLTVLLRELDYAEDYTVAEVEIDLEAEGRLADFVRVCAQRYGDVVKPPNRPPVVPVTLAGAALPVTAEEYGAWQMVRKSSDRILRVSAVLNALDPATHPQPDSWARTLGRESAVTVRTLVERTFDLTARRHPGHTIVFVIDEVGQYVARSAERIENLRAVVEYFGKEGRNRVAAGQARAPVWIVITSQEKLDEVVAAIGDKRVELARLQDRFRTRIDLAPTDIREVATRRVLSKKPQAEAVLRQLFESGAAMLKTHARLEQSSHASETDADAFVQFYPYLPHFIDLSIDIVSGMRQQPGAPKHYGGSNRTIIKQAYEMLVSERTALADAPVGTLVTLDRIFDLVEGNLSSEKQKDIGDIAQTWPGDPWPLRVAKAIALLEFVRDVPRTEANLAALLYPHIGADSPLPEVQRAVGLLQGAQFVRLTEQGWKLQTAQEKSWAAERNAHNPSPKEQDDIVEDSLRSLFAEATLSRYQYRPPAASGATGQRYFRVGVNWAGHALSSGDAQIPVQLRVAEAPEVFAEICDRARDDSRADPQRNEVFWVINLTQEIDEVVAELYRSRQMVSKYNQLRAQSKLIGDQSAMLDAEKLTIERAEARLKALLESELTRGRGFFRGIAKDGAALGKTAGAIFKALFDFAVPDLYPKLELGARTLKGNEADQVLKAANLNGLPKVFYDPPDGLGLVVTQGSKFVINLAAPVLKETSDYLAREHAYGNKVTGKALETVFSGIGYGWEQPMIWLALATLLRGGAIEVTYQGRRYRSHLDPQVHAAFGGTNAFRSASFAPRVGIDLNTLVAAARRYEALTGEEIDVEEATIAQAFQRLARTELEALLPVEAAVKANGIPAQAILQEYHGSLDAVLNSPSDDCVRMLAGEGASLQDLREQVNRVRRTSGEKGLAYLRRLRAAVQQLWPPLQAHALALAPAGDGAGDGPLALDVDVETIQSHLQGATFYPPSAALDAALAAVESAYSNLYRQRHAARRAAYDHAVDEVKAQPAWPLLPEASQPALLRPLAERACQELQTLPTGSAVCPHCRATLAEMAAHLQAVAGLRSDVLLRLQQLTAPEEKVERVRLSDVAGVGQSLSSPQEVDDVIEQLRAHLLKLIAAGVKVVLE